MAEELTPEQRAAIGQRLADGRKRAAEAKAEHPMMALDAKTENGGVVPKIAYDPACAMCRGDALNEPGKSFLLCRAHASLPTVSINILDIVEPAKWQMKVRVYLESLDASAADEWVEGFRMITTMAARIARDKVHMQVTGRCYVCSKPFKMGRPEGEAGYYDRDGQYIKVYCCHQAEYPELLKMIMGKEQAVKAAEERTAKAVRQALIDVRGRVEREA